MTHTRSSLRSGANMTQKVVSPEVSPGIWEMPDVIDMNNYILGRPSYRP